jgi:hypothetical protein
MKLIGGAIALSGYSKEPVVKDWWRIVAIRLWKEGATLAFGGRWTEGPGGWLMIHLNELLQKRPPEPSNESSQRENPAPWVKNFLDEDQKNSVEISPEDRTRMGLHVRFASYTPRAADAISCGVRRREK